MIDESQFPPKTKQIVASHWLPPTLQISSNPPFTIKNGWGKRFVKQMCGLEALAPIIPRTSFANESIGEKKRGSRY